MTKLSTGEVKNITTARGDRAIGDDAVIPAEDERGRPGVFVSAHPLDRAGQISDDVLERVRQEVEFVRSQTVHVHAPAGSRSRRAVRAPVLATIAGLAVDARGQVAVPLPLLDELIEDIENQLMLLRAIRSGSGRVEPERVRLESPTGSVEYVLPLSTDETYGSSDVSEILSPTGKGHRTIAQHRRQSNELLGVKIGNQYRYPKFQLDAERHEIRPAVAYANKALESSADPWGTLDWWFSPEIAFDRRRPVDMVASGELTEELVDLAIDVSTVSMD